jgi:transcriptional regulator NrdR family protein
MSICTQCGSWSSKTKETRRDTRYNWKWRWRVCNDCGHDWQTYEIPTDSLTNPEPANPDGKLNR